MIRLTVDFVLHLLGWVLMFGAAIELVAVHPKLVLLLTGCAMTVVARKLL